MPAIQIVPPDDLQPLRDAIAEVASFDWIIFTSANGVAAFFDALHEAGLDSRALAGSKLCTIGPVTAETLAAHGLSADAQPAKFVSSEIASTLAAADSLAGKNILCPRADVAPRDLIEALEAEGAVVTNVVAYCTRPDCTGADQVIEMLGEDDVQWVTFTSSSTVKNFFGAVDPKIVRAASVRLASIGPVTSDTLREFGFEPDTEAESHTIDGLTSAILDCEDA
jgi:uroporphyrinogen III methyltransferase/synthase